jgi:diguanylate cyclase (GGDEF)-like protein
LTNVFLLLVLPVQFYRVGRRIVESSKHLREENLRDALTRVFNRKALESALLLALAEQKPFVLTFFDLDNFKKVNDTRGHATGDKLLKRICAKLELRLRSEDRLYRLSGDEFIVLSPSFLKPEAAETLGHRIREAIREVIEVTCPEVEVSASVGVLVVDEGQGQSMSELLHRADNLMYEAKRSGKNKVLVKQLHAKTQLS